MFFLSKKQLIFNPLFISYFVIYLFCYFFIILIKGKKGVYYGITRKLLKCRFTLFKRENI